MALFDSLAEQSAKMAEQQREALKQNSSFVFSKILNKEVKIYEKDFSTVRGEKTFIGKVTDVYETYIELDNKTLVSTKFISSIEIL